MAATNASASNPCDHHSACRTADSAESPAPIASKPWAATQPAAHHHQHETGQQREAQHVEHDRVAEIEVALEEAPAEDRLREVGVDREDHGPDEQHEEA